MTGQWVQADTQEVLPEHQKPQLTVKMIKHWCRLPRKVVETPCLEIFKSYLILVTLLEQWGGTRRLWCSILTSGLGSVIPQVVLVKGSPAGRNGWEQGLRRRALFGHLNVLPKQTAQILGIRPCSGEHPTGVRGVSPLHCSNTNVVLLLKNKPLKL